MKTTIKQTISTLCLGATLALLTSLPARALEHSSIEEEAYVAAVNALESGSKARIDDYEILSLLEFSAGKGHIDSIQKLVMIHKSESSRFYNIDKAQELLFHYAQQDNFTLINYAYNKFSKKDNPLYSKRLSERLEVIGADAGFERYAIILLEKELEKGNEDSSDIYKKYYPLLKKASEENPKNTRVAKLHFEIINLGKVPTKIDKWSILKPLFESGDLSSINMELSRSFREDIPTYNVCMKNLGLMAFRDKYHYKNDMSKVDVISQRMYQRCSKHMSKAFMNDAFQYADEIYVESGFYQVR